MENYMHWFSIVGVATIFLFMFWRVGDFVWWRPRRIELHFSKQGIRGPKYHLLLGNTREIVEMMTKAAAASDDHSQLISPHNILPRVLSFYHHWKKIYGSTFVIWFGPKARLTISDPVLIREVMIVRSDLFEKVEAPPHLKKLEGGGLLSLQGDKWAHHRKIITPSFYLENLKLMMPIIGKSMEKMLDKWTEMSTTKRSSGSAKVEIEVSQWFERLSEEILTHTAFGCSHADGKLIFDLQAKQVVNAIGCFNKVVIPGYRWRFIEECTRVQDMLTEEPGKQGVLLMPLKLSGGYCLLAKRFLPTKKNRTSWRLGKEMKKLLRELIDKRKKTCNGKPASKECPSDLLELMIRESMKKEEESNTSFLQLPRNMTTNDIVEECKSVFFAGKYTTSALLTWTTVLLAMHPQWQQLARDEVLETCGAHGVPSKHNLAELKTLGMILNESLRLYPPVIALLRRAKNGVVLGGCTIPSETELLIPIIAIHHDASLWGHDATEFNPARFARGVAHAAKHPVAFMPFGLGPRRCIGQNLAVLQAKLVIAMILQRFSFELAPSYRHHPSVVMLLNPLHGAPIIFHKL